MRDLETMSGLEKLTAERDALAAQVEALQSTAAKVVTGDAEIAELEPLLDATPQYHLAEIRAEAGRAGFVAGSEQTAQFITGEIGYALPLLEARANQYAEQIRKGEVE